MSHYWNFNPESSIESLPAEILTEVFKLLPAKYLLTIRLVCNFWRDVILRLPVFVALRYV